MTIERIDSRRDLELTVVDRESEPPSRRLEDRVEAVAQPFVARRISNCSWDCTRDVLYTLSTSVGCVISSIAAVESKTTKLQVAYGLFSIAFGIIALGLTIYGTTIRCCPRTQRR